MASFHFNDTNNKFVANWPKGQEGNVEKQYFCALVCPVYVNSEVHMEMASRRIPHIYTMAN